MVKEGLCLLSFIEYIKNFFLDINAFLIQQRLPILIQNSVSSLVISTVVFLVGRNSVDYGQRVCVFVVTEKWAYYFLVIFTQGTQISKRYLVLN